MVLYIHFFGLLSAHYSFIVDSILKSKPALFLLQSNSGLKWTLCPIYPLEHKLTWVIVLFIGCATVIHKYSAAKGCLFLNLASLPTQYSMKKYQSARSNELIIPRFTKRLQVIFCDKRGNFFEMLLKGVPILC